MRKTMILAAMECNKAKREAICAAAAAADATTLEQIADWKARSGALIDTYLHMVQLLKTAQ